MAEIAASIDTRTLDKIGQTIAFYAQSTGKDLADTSNRALRQIAIVASAKTPAVDPNKIEAELRKVVAHQVFAKSNGKRLKRPKPITKRTRLANSIVWARAHAKGETITVDEAEKRARALTAVRKRSVKFVRSGYIPALVALKARKTDAGKQRGKPKGSVQLATPARFQAMLANEVQGDIGGLAVKIGAKAVAAAIPEVERDMREFAEKKLAERAAKANAAS